MHPCLISLPTGNQSVVPHSNLTTAGCSGAIQVLRNADGGGGVGGGCLIFWKKALRRCNVQCY